MVVFGHFTILYFSPYPPPLGNSVLNPELNTLEYALKTRPRAANNHHSILESAISVTPPLSPADPCQKLPGFVSWPPKSLTFAIWGKLFAE